jgi:hypothetical protein
MTNNLVRCKVCNQYTPNDELCDKECACTECCTCSPYYDEVDDEDED